MIKSPAHQKAGFYIAEKRIAKKGKSYIIYIIMENDYV